MMKEWSFLILEVPYVFIRICLTAIVPVHNVWMPQGEGAASLIPGRGLESRNAIHAMHIGMLFLRRLTSEREQCANSLEILGWTASRRAGRDRELTPSVSSNIG